MPICPLCHSDYNDTAKFCSHCGFELATHDLLACGTILDRRYQIFQVVGGGGMSTVYKAFDTRLGNTTRAVKEIRITKNLDPAERADAIQQFRREAEILAGLDHRNLPKVYDFFPDSGKHYLVMDFVDGSDLRWILDSEDDQLDLQCVVNYVAQLCDVLEYLHDQSPPVIFRDLKPSNVILSSSGVIKLIDFGIARLFEKRKAKDTQVMGTPGYAAPEQYGQAQTDPRSDIYSLGVVFHELLTRHDPSENPFRLPAVDSLNNSVPIHYARIVERATDLNPSNRYQSVRDFRMSLLDALRVREINSQFIADPHTRAASVSRPCPDQESGTKQLQSWTTFTNAQSATDLVFDGRGDLWTVGGAVAKWNLKAQTYTRYTTDDGLPANTGSIAIAPDGTVWLGTSLGLAHFEGSKWITYSAGPLLRGGLRAMAVAPNGSVWIGNDDGISYFSGKRWTNLTLSDSLELVDSMAFTPDGTLWCGVFRNGVFCFDGERWKHDIIEELDKGGPSVSRIFVEPDGVVWCVASNVAYRFDGRVWSEFSIWQRQDGVLWIETSDYGVHQYNGVEWTVWDELPFHDNKGYRGMSISAVHIASDGILWIAARDGLFRFDGHQWTTYSKSDGLLCEKVYAITEHPVGQMCFGTDQGISVFSEQKWTTYIVTDSGCMCAYQLPVLSC